MKIEKLNADYSNKDFIIVMDSGVGGISVLREMVRIMPDEDFVYFGDSANAPYGTKSVKEVRALVFAAVERFLGEGAKAVAIACNTATSAAVKDLRVEYPELPIVGIEPALKPAAEAHPGGRILVMATPMTIREEKFQRLLSRFKDRAEVIPLACPGLMDFVEAGKADSDEVEAFLRELLSPVTDEAGVDAVVLGCTHYPFVARRIRRVLGEKVDIFDGGEGTARELLRRLKAAGLAREGQNTGQGLAMGAGRIRLVNSDPSPERIVLSKKLLEVGS